MIKTRRPGRSISHVLNRVYARMTNFETDQDYAGFERILSEAVERFSDAAALS